MTPDELAGLWDFDDPAGSEQRFRSLLPRARDERDDAFLVDVLTQIARAEGLQRRFAEADRTLDEAEAALRPGDDRRGIRVLLERGRVANTAGREGRGAEQFREAWACAERPAKTLAVDAAHMLGIVEPPSEAGRGTSGRWSSPAARRIRRRGAGSHLWRTTWAGRSTTQAHTRRLSSSSGSRSTSAGARRPRELRIARWSVARCLRSLGRVEEALAEQRSLATELDAAGETDGYVDEEIAECLLDLGREDERGRSSPAHTRSSAATWG